MLNPEFSIARHNDHCIRIIDETRPSFHLGVLEAVSVETTAWIHRSISPVSISIWLRAQLVLLRPLSDGCQTRKSSSDASRNFRALMKSCA